MSNLGSGREVVDAAPDLPLQKGDIELVHRDSACASKSTVGGVVELGGGGVQLLGTICWEDSPISAA